jgi:uncharacterized protein YlxP (DUF503 family)
VYRKRKLDTYETSIRQKKKKRDVTPRLFSNKEKMIISVVRTVLIDYYHSCMFSFAILIEHEVVEHELLVVVQY